MGVNIHVGSPTLTVLPAFRHRAHRRPPLVGPAPGAGGLGQAGACSLRAGALREAPGPGSGPDGAADKVRQIGSRPPSRPPAPARPPHPGGRTVRPTTAAARRARSPAPGIVNHRSRRRRPDLPGKHPPHWARKRSLVGGQLCPQFCSYIGQLRIDPAALALGGPFDKGIFWAGIGGGGRSGGPTPRVAGPKAAGATVSSSVRSGLLQRGRIAVLAAA